MAKYLEVGTEVKVEPWFVSDPVNLQRIANLEKTKKELQYLKEQSEKGRMRWLQVSCQRLDTLTS